MKMPGYWVEQTEVGVSLTRTVFDETDLDSATGWKEAWQNQDPQVTVRGYVAIEAALAYGRGLLPEAKTEAPSRKLPVLSDEVLEFHSRQEIDLFPKSVLP